MQCPFSRLVIKVGSGLLVDASREPNTAFVAGLADEIARLRANQVDVLLVSSGAIALGAPQLGIKSRGRRLDELQAAAAVGQVALAQLWQSHLDAHGLRAAQLLLTLGDTESRRRYLNALDTIRVLLKRGVVPVINENDTVATDEIRFGDNDGLAARVAQMVDADALVLLSDVDGLYTKHPSDIDAELVARIDRIDASTEAMVSERRSSWGSGGMRSKLAAASLATAAGVEVFVTNGTRSGCIERWLDGGPATHFVASARPERARKRWIAGALRPAGQLWLDAGACTALRNGKSLLPVGVRRVDGAFQRGDTVVLVDEQGIEIARGLCACDAAETRALLSESSVAVSRHGALIHRNDLVLTEREASL
ncbi:MAG: glutamate 5-kinase [Pseudomonadota bacterium]